MGTFNIESSPDYEPEPSSQEFLQWPKNHRGESYLPQVITHINEQKINGVNITGPSGSGKSHLRRLIEFNTHAKPFLLLSEPEIHDMVKVCGLASPTTLEPLHWDLITHKLSQSHQAIRSTIGFYPGNYYIFELPTDGAWRKDLPIELKWTIKNRGMSLLEDLGHEYNHKPLSETRAILIRQIAHPKVVEKAIRTRSVIRSLNYQQVIPYLKTEHVQVHHPSLNNDHILGQLVQHLIFNESDPIFLLNQYGAIHKALDYWEWTDRTEKLPGPRLRYQQETLDYSRSESLKPFFGSLNREESNFYARWAAFLYSQAIEMGWNDDQIIVAYNPPYPTDDHHQIHWYLGQE
jgi:hypothetical protein